MFTGLVEAVGTVGGRRADDGGVVFEIASEIAAGFSGGESVCVDGVCLTVTETAEDRFTVEAVRTTLSRSTLGDYRTGRRVNLERALEPGDRLGGHWVQGHVDGVGRVAEVEPAGETVFLRVELPGAVARTTIRHGSLAVDGVSLTVNDLARKGGGTAVAELAIIPYTWEHTALDRLAPGDRVNLEADVMGKYVAKLLDPYLEQLPGRAGPPGAGSPGPDADSDDE